MKENKKNASQKKLPVLFKACKICTDQSLKH